MNAQQHALHTSAIKSLDLINSGKVRDIYALDEEHILIVTTDRLSAFDVILPQAIPGKGAVLTSVSNFWFERTKDIIRNHLSDITLAAVLPDAKERKPIEGRGIVVKKLKPLPVEAIVRGYLIGSGWQDYQKTGAVCGITLPTGLQQAEQLSEAIYTPSTKAELGAHDQAAEYARKRGIIIADTKFEFGSDQNGELFLIDEALTPDSSRFWPAASYEIGMSPPSFDKQYVRDYLETLNWDKTPPAPELPEAVINNTAAKYREAQDRLMG